MSSRIFLPPNFPAFALAAIGPNLANFARDTSDAMLVEESNRHAVLRSAAERKSITLSLPVATYPIGIVYEINVGTRF